MALICKLGLINGQGILSRFSQETVRREMSEIFHAVYEGYRSYPLTMEIET